MLNDKINQTVPKRILLQHGGSLGDTLAIMPACAFLRRAFPEAEIELLVPRHAGFGTWYLDLFDNTGYVDHFVHYRAEGAPWLRHAKLLLKLHRRNYDLVVNLIRSHPQLAKRVRRDRLFFKWAGIKRRIGDRELFDFTDGDNAPHHIELFLRRLAANGIAIPSDWRDLTAADYFKFTPEEYSNAEVFCRSLPLTGSMRALAVGVVGKKPVCRWAPDRYLEVLRHLRDEYDFLPVFFGGPDDIACIGEYITKLGFGVCAGKHGSLSLRETICAMRNCVGYLGNDTGIIHMAAAAGIPCLGIYSAHNYRGLWYPFVKARQVLRANVDCALCMKNECENLRCMEMIDTGMVLQAAAKLWETRP